MLNTTGVLWRKINDTNHIRVIGLTATPFHEAKGYQSFWNQIHSVYQDIESLQEIDVIEQLAIAMDKGLLVPLKKVNYFNIDEIQELEIRKVDTERNIRYVNPYYYDQISDYLKPFFDKHEYGFIHVGSQHEADILCAFLNQKFPEIGFGVYTSKTDESALENLQSGIIRMLIVVDKMREGVDIPKLSLLIDLAPSQSPKVFFQLLGRILRPSIGKFEIDLVSLISISVEKLNEYIEQRYPQLRVTLQQLDNEEQKEITAIKIKEDSKHPIKKQKKIQIEIDEEESNIDFLGKILGLEVKAEEFFNNSDKKTLADEISEHYNKYEENLPTQKTHKSLRERTRLVLKDEYKREEFLNKLKIINIKAYKAVEKWSKILNSDSLLILANEISSYYNSKKGNRSLPKDNTDKLLYKRLLGVLKDEDKREEFLDRLKDINIKAYKAAEKWSEKLNGDPLFILANEISSYYNSKKGNNSLPTTESDHALKERLRLVLKDESKREEFLNKLKDINIKAHKAVEEWSEKLNSDLLLILANELSSYYDSENGNRSLPAAERDDTLRERIRAVLKDEAKRKEFLNKLRDIDSKACEAVEEWSESLNGDPVLILANELSSYYNSEEGNRSLPPEKTHRSFRETVRLVLKDKSKREEFLTELEKINEDAHKAVEEWSENLNGDPVLILANEISSYYNSEESKKSLPTYSTQKGLHKRLQKVIKDESKRLKFLKELEKINKDAYTAAKARVDKINNPE